MKNSDKFEDIVTLLASCMERSTVSIEEVVAAWKQKGQTLTIAADSEFPDRVFMINAAIQFAAQPNIDHWFWILARYMYQCIERGQWSDDLQNLMDIIHVFYPRPIVQGWHGEHWVKVPHTVERSRAIGANVIKNVFGIDIGIIDEAMARNLHIPNANAKDFNITDLYCHTDGSMTVVVNGKANGREVRRMGHFPKPAAIVNLLRSRLFRYDLGTLHDTPEATVDEAAEQLAQHFGKHSDVIWLMVEDLFWILGRTTAR